MPETVDGGHCQHRPLPSGALAPASCPTVAVTVESVSRYVLFLAFGLDCSKERAFTAFFLRAVLLAFFALAARRSGAQRPSQLTRLEVSRRRFAEDPHRAQPLSLLAVAW